MISRSTTCSTWCQDPENCTMSLLPPSSALSRWSSYVWWCSALPGEWCLCTHIHTHTYTHADICVSEDPFLILQVFCIQGRNADTSAAARPPLADRMQFTTFNKRFYKRFVIDKTAPLSTVAEEEEGQNESASTCKGRRGADAREEMRIYYSTDYSYSAINASCYSAISIQSIKHAKKKAC